MGDREMMLPLLVFGPMVCAPICYALGKGSKALRAALMAAVGVLAFAGCLTLWGRETAFALPGFCGLGLSLRADGFRSLYATVAAFMWMMTGLFSPEYFAHYHHRGRYCFFNLMTLGATLGVFLSDDLFTTFIFFEVMSLTSYAWVAHEETPAALRAAGTYLAVAVIGGLTTLMGLFLLYADLGTLSFTGLREAIGALDAVPVRLKVASWLVLVGFAAKAGLYPLHIWLPKAHPVAPAPASALLSGILTKSGVFGVIVLCAFVCRGDAAFGNGLLVLSAVTMVLGAVLALFSVDLKRTLACSSMSQIGFICVGLSMSVLLGEEGGLAAWGAVEHMVNHSLIKLCLFLCAGVVFMNLHRLNLNDIRGYGRKKPLLHLCFLLGALSIACIPPLGSGYASKSLLHEGILEYIAHLQAAGLTWWPYRLLEVLFLLSGGLTVAYMLKLYICLFWERNADEKRQAEFDAQRRCMNPLTAGVLLVTSLVLPLLGAMPERLLTPLAARSAAFLGQAAPTAPIAYFSLENLQGALISIAVGAAVYLLIVRPLLMTGEKGHRVYADRWPAKLDLESGLYRPVLLKALPAVCCLVVRLLSELPERLALWLRNGILRKKTAPKPVPVGTRFTYACGRFADAVAAFLNATICKRAPIRTDFEYVLDASWNVTVQSLTRVFRSISFGLLLLGIGLLLTCVYLLTR